MNGSASSLRALRLMSSCPTPHNSGNSERIVLPPSAASISAVCPIAGFADRPEKPSEPPHFNPRHKLESGARVRDRKSTRLNSSHQIISYAVFCLKKKMHKIQACTRD